MFDNSVGILEIAARTAIVYVAILAGLRLGGKREIGQMQPFDLVVILLIANAVQNAMVGSDVSVTGGLVAAAVLIIVNVGVQRGRQYVPFFRRAVEGEPTLLVDEGQWVTKHLKREGIDQEDVEMAMREHGVDDLKEVRTAVLETDGSISIVQKNQSVMRTKKRVRAIKRGS